MRHTKLKSEIPQCLCKKYLATFLTIVLAFIAFMMFGDIGKAQPTITSPYPDGTVQFQPSATLGFTAGDGTAVTSISVTLVGSNLLGQVESATYTDQSGLTVSPSLPSSSVTVSAPLAPNTFYTAAIKVVGSSDGAVSSTISFDTITPTYTFEAEDFDYSNSVISGLFFDQSTPLTPTPDEYLNLGAGPGIDCTNYNAGSGSHSYRLDNVNCLETEAVGDKPRAQYVSSGAVDYDVGYSHSNNFACYSRTYPAGLYYIFMRGANGGGTLSNTASMNLVTSGRGTKSQTFNKMGTFSFPPNGGQYQSYAFAPLEDSHSNFVAWAAPGDVETLREQDIGGGENVNFYLLVPATPILTPATSGSIYFSGDVVTLSMDAQALQTPTYQWQQSTDGINWNNVGTGATNYVVPTTTLAAGNYQYQLVLSGISPTLTSVTVTSSVVALTIHAPSAPIVFQNTTPSSDTQVVGTFATFTASFVGNQPVTNQWQVSTDGGAVWAAVAGATNTTLTVDCTTVGTNEYRLMAGNSIGPSFSTPATLNVLSQGPVQLFWSTQPGSAITNSPFGRQPVLITADANGNPTSTGLPATLMVTVDTLPTPGGLVGGAFTFNMGSGPGGSNGVADFQNLQINTLGGYQLSAVCGNGTNEVFSPTNGINGCVLWLDAGDDSTLTITNGHLVDWTDKSGTGNTATNPTPTTLANTPTVGSNPVLDALAIGGGQAVICGSGYLNVNLSMLTSNAYSVVALETLGTASPNNSYFIGTPSDSGKTDATLHIGYQNSTTFHWGQYADDVNYTAPGGTWASGVARSWELSKPDRGDKYMYLGGVQVAHGGGNWLTTTVVPGTVCRGNGANYVGDLSEIVVYTNGLTPLQVVQLDNYLQNKWLGNLSSSATTAIFNVGNGEQVSGLAFVQEPSSEVAGTTIAPSVTVIVTNSAGVGLSGIPITLTISSGTGVLAGTVTQTTGNNGIATYGDLSITAAGTKQLSAVVSGLVTNTSSSFVITAAAPVQIGITTQPSATAIAGVNFATQPVVAIEDQYGNPVLTDTDAIIASQTAGGTLSQTPANAVQVAAVGGYATFSGLNITNAGTSTLTFTDGSDTALSTINSSSIVVAANVPSTMVFQQAPSSTAEVGVAFGSQPTVNLTDVYGNPVADGTVVIASATPGPLLGQTSVQTAGGVAAYAGLSLTNTGNITLNFTAGSASISSPITVSIGPVTQVIWTTQPGRATNGLPFGQQPVLQTADAGGHLSTINLGATNMVVVSQYAGSGLTGGPLTFNMGTAGSNGVATFNDLQIDTAGESNILDASLLGLMTSPTNGIAEPCILWLDAYDSSTLVVSNGNLVEWLDKSGTTNNASNTGNYPTVGLDTNLAVTAYGGQQVVQFAGNNWLNMSLSNLDESYYVSTYGGYLGFTVVALEITPSFNGSSYYIGSSYNGADSTLHIGYNNSDDFHLGFYGDDLNYDPTVPFTTSTPRIWSVGQDQNDNQYVYLNGTQVATRSANNLISLIGAAVGRGNGSAYTGDLAEIAVYNASLSDQDRQSVEQYLIYKWLSNSKSFSAPFTVVGTSAITPLIITPDSIKVVGSGASGTVQFAFTNASGLTFSVCATNNLTIPRADWPVIGTATENPVGSGQYQFIDLNPPTNSMRFYFLRQP